MDDDDLQELDYAMQLRRQQDEEQEQKELAGFALKVEAHRYLVEYLKNEVRLASQHLRDLEQEMLRRDPGYQAWLDELKEHDHAEG